MVGGIGLACGHAGHRPETSVTKLQCIDLQPSTQPWIFNLDLSTHEADDTLFSPWFNWMDHATDTLAAFFACPSCPMRELNNVRANSQAKSNYVGICGQLIWLHAKGSTK